MCVGLAVSGMQGIIMCGGDKNLSLCEGTSRNIVIQVLIIMLWRNIYRMSAACVVTYWSLLSVLLVINYMSRDQFTEKDEIMK